MVKLNFSILAAVLIGIDREVIVIEDKLDTMKDKLFSYLKEKKEIENKIIKAKENIFSEERTKLKELVGLSFYSQDHNSLYYLYDIPPIRVDEDGSVFCNYYQVPAIQVWLKSNSNHRKGQIDYTTFYSLAIKEKNPLSAFDEVEKIDTDTFILLVIQTIREVLAEKRS